MRETESKRARISKESDSTFGSASDFFSSRTRNDVVVKMFSSLETDEAKRAQIQDLMKDSKHNMALEGYEYIKLLNSTDWLGKAECNEKIGEEYLGRQLFQLAIEFYRGALTCLAECSKVLAKEEMAEEIRVARTREVRARVERVFPKLVKALNGCIERWSINYQHMEQFLDFYLTHFDFLNKNQAKLLVLDDIALNDNIKAHLKGPKETVGGSLRTITRFLVTAITLFTSATSQDHQELKEEIEALRRLDNKDLEARTAQTLFHRAVGIGMTLAVSQPPVAEFKAPASRSPRSPGK